MNRADLPPRLFLIISALGSLYMLIEAVLQSLGRSLCATEGCRVVAQYSRFGDLSLVLLGLAMAASLAVLAAREMRSADARPARAIDVLLVISLAGEGFLAGYQLFWLQTVCVFCLSVLGLFVALGALRMLTGRREVIAGFGSLIALFGLFALLLPAGGTPLPPGHQYVLFYSADCRHCGEVRKELEERKIAAASLPVREHAAFLKVMGIESVPTLMVNGPYEKIFLTGTEAIRNYLSCQPAPITPAKGAKRAKPAPADNKSGVGRQAGPPDLFAPTIVPGQLFNPRPDDGLCKEDVKCD